MRKNTVRRISTRTNTNLKKVETEEKVVEKQKIEELKDAYIVKNLSFINPNVGKNGVYYSYIDNKFQKVTDDETYLEIFNLDEGLIREDDALYISQDEYHEMKRKFKVRMREKGKEIEETEIDSEKSLRNKLNYCERSSETQAKKIITREVGTKKLDRVDFNGIFHEWDLFDSYMATFIKKKAEDKRQEEIKMKGSCKPREKIQVFGDSINRPSLLKALKLLERQIMQIVNQAKYSFYREWNGKENETDSNSMIGMLLSFPQNARIKNRSVTALCWNTKFEDLFAAGYGNYDFPKKKEEKGDIVEKEDELNESGYIYVYSIKNNFFPEIKYKTDSGVLCLDFHPKDYNLLVAGLYDGSVNVFDISTKSKMPYLTCNIRTQKHMDPVWQVKWYTHSNDPGEYVFYSISSDGKVKRWSFFKTKSEFETEDIIVLRYLDTHQKENEPKMIGREEAIQAETQTNVTMNDISKDKSQEEQFNFGNSGGMCFDFNKNPGFEHLFIVGTEEGRIYLCSTNHREHAILNYEGHSMGVYTVSWNPFHPKVFASCSSDWTIKIWHYKVYAPLMVYDMQSAIGDLAWSPWCSTIFASVNVGGEIQFFDLNRARKEPLAPKKIKDVPINHIAFNKTEFVVITGNDAGKVHLWKMAEPLRVTVDKKELEEKERLKAAQELSKKAGPTTKIVVPQNLQENLVKVRRAGIQKKQVKAIDKKVEKGRVDEFLELLDITDL